MKRIKPKRLLRRKQLKAMYLKDEARWNRFNEENPRVKKLKQMFANEFSKPEKTQLWGQELLAEKVVIDQEFGDGLKILAFSPLATRPNYYIVFIDSSWVIDGDDDNSVSEHTDEIYEAISEEYGELCGYTLEECEAQNHGKSCGFHLDSEEDEAEFPVLDDSCGSSWWLIADLNKNKYLELSNLRKTQIKKEEFERLYETV